MVNSLVWTPDEAKYLKAIFRWQETVASAEDEKRRREAEDAARSAWEQKPAAEFRILVIGGRGTGKTALLTRFAQGTFHGEDHPPDPFYERGRRHPVTLDMTPPTITTTTTTTASTPTLPTTLIPSSPITKSNLQPHPNNNSNGNHHSPQTQTYKQTYMIDTLELPSKHLHSNPMLAQALSITEAAVLVYSVRDDASFRLAQGLAEFMHEHFSPASSSSSSFSSAPSIRRSLIVTTTSSSIRPRSFSPSLIAKLAAAAGNIENTTAVGGGGGGCDDKGRICPLILVGNKSDTPLSSCSSSSFDDDEPVAVLQSQRAVARMRMPAAERTFCFSRCRPRLGKGWTRYLRWSARRCCGCGGR
ncbi:hypothetical protein N657DRAFT_657263 [Parathielavia appendiculata]|uniref:small monomeric GTPase n=1 Tax=Parathielavia appendiculata TaxID=2587402 RepID=A0AAN6TXC7_9PEZI|nr:hypothetical protein N657DRAFT_657263 [Parathielavia appendiculata]